MPKVWREVNDLMVRKLTGKCLHYYKPYASEYARTRQLLAFRDGQCGSWAKLFLDVLKAQGIRFAENYVFVEPDDTALGIPGGISYGFLVKDWSFEGVGNADRAVECDPGSDIDKLIKTHGFTYLNVIGLDPMSHNPRRERAYEWLYAEVQDVVGVGGQGVQNPASRFGNHQFVQVNIGGVIKWLDPSYGLEYEGATEDDRLLDFDNKAIAGYFVVVRARVREAVLGDLNGDGDDLDVHDAWIQLAKKNPAGNQLKRITSKWGSDLTEY